jgi:hypothetical protein
MGGFSCEPREAAYFRRKESKMTKSTKVSNQRLIRALLASNSISGAARLADCSKQTVYNRLADEDFNREYQAAMDAAQASFQEEINNAGKTAFETLAEIAGAQYGVSDELKAKASATILQYLSKK